MSFNYSGTPIGAALAGTLASQSIESAVAFGVVTALISGAIAMVMLKDNNGGVSYCL
jgi:hypothetical protein